MSSEPQEENPVQLVFQSELPGDINDLTFTGKEFIDACLRVQNTPYTEENEDWLRLGVMYNRVKTLRIDPMDLCAGRVPRSLLGSRVHSRFLVVNRHLDSPDTLPPHGLPFTAQEFLTICDEFEKLDAINGVLHPAEYRGSETLFLRMVDDLATLKVNLKEFLADRIPPSMEDNFALMMLMASAQGKHTQNFAVNFTRFLVAMAAPGGCLKGRLIGPTTHLQAAVFVQSLDSIVGEVSTLSPRSVEYLGTPHGRCKVGVSPENIKAILTPCCGQPRGSCCMIAALMHCGPACEFCGVDMVELVRRYGHEL